jgi:hypothetical protein
MSRAVHAAILAAFIVLPVSATQAASLGSDCITLNVASDCAIGESQLTLDVLDVGGGQVLFRLENSGPEAATVANVYFDDSNGHLDGIADLIGSVGVSFRKGGSPKKLPGGNGNPLRFDTDFRAAAKSSPSKNGVGASERLDILFDLSSGSSFADVVADLASGDMIDAALRVGVHVIGYTSEGSESFVATPEPRTAVLVALGLVGLGVARARRP